MFYIPLFSFFMSQVIDQQSHYLHLIMVYFIFVTTIFRLIVFKFYDILYYFISFTIFYFILITD